MAKSAFLVPENIQNVDLPNNFKVIAQRSFIKSLLSTISGIRTLKAVYAKGEHLHQLNSECICIFLLLT